MNPEEVTKRLEKIFEVVFVEENDRLDHAEAHELQDDLWRDVLIAIARGTAEDPKGCAEKAILVLGLPFERWYE